MRYFLDKCKEATFETFAEDRKSLVRTNNELQKKIKAISPPRYRCIIQLCCFENANQGRKLKIFGHLILQY